MDATDRSFFSTNMWKEVPEFWVYCVYHHRRQRVRCPSLRHELFIWPIASVVYPLFSANLICSLGDLCNKSRWSYMGLCGPLYEINRKSVKNGGYKSVLCLSFLDTS